MHFYNTFKNELTTNFLEVHLIVIFRCNCHTNFHHTKYRVRASPASLCCGPWARRIYPSLVLVQPRKTRPCLTESLLMGRKESNQTNKQSYKHVFHVCAFSPVVCFNTIFYSSIKDHGRKNITMRACNLPLRFPQISSVRLNAAL